MSLESLYGIKYLDTLEQKILHNMYLLLGSTFRTLELSNPTVRVDFPLLTTFSTIIVGGTDPNGTLSISVDPDNKFLLVNGNELQLDNVPVVGQHLLTIRFTDSLGNITDFIKTITITSVSFVNSRSISFNGTNQWIKIPSVALNKFGSAMSVSAWFKFRVDIGQTEIISAVNASADDWNIRMNNDGSIQFGAGTYYVKTPAPSYKDNLWHHVVCTFYANEVSEIYVDNVSTSVITVAGSPIPTLTQTATHIGVGARLYTVPASFCDMAVDELTLWNKKLSTGDITLLYNSGVPNNVLSHPSVGNLQGYYRFEAPDNVNSIEDHAGVSNIVETTATLTFTGDVPN